MSFWRPYCAVGIPAVADASTLVSNSTISGISTVAGLPSAVYVCDVTSVYAAIANVLVVTSCCYCLSPE
jgi:hypothetical protein